MAVLIAVLGCAGPALCFASSSQKTDCIKLHEYECGDEFDLPLSLSANESAILMKDYVLVLCFPSAYKDFEDDLFMMSRMMSIFNSANLRYAIVWEENVSLSCIEQYCIPIDVNYTLSENCYFNTDTAAFFILNEGIITFSSNTLNDLIESAMLLEDFQNKDAEANAVQYIRTNILGQDIRKAIVYFAMTGCSDCAAADNVLNNNADMFSEFTILRIYRPNKIDRTKEIDRYGLFKCSLRIDWYPTFLVIVNDSYWIIRETPIDLLLDSLLECTKAL